MEAGEEIVGELGALDVALRRLRWRVERVGFDGSLGELVLEGGVEGEAAPLRHCVTVQSLGESSCRVHSEVCYAPEPPLQTLLNAAGGRQSVVDGNAAFVRRVGVVAAGDVDFDPEGFYDLAGRAVDLLAPFEDDARSLLAERAGLTQSGAGLRVLEIGCGTGRWAKSLLEAEGGTGIGRYLGVDASESMALAAAGELAGTAAGAAAVVRADAREPGALAALCGRFLGGGPDRILLTYVLDLLDEADSLALLAECRGLLEESGGLLGLCCICPGGALMGPWAEVWRVAPGLVGGCRPVDLAEVLRGVGWKLELEERLDVLGYSSQVLLARPPGGAGASTRGDA